MHASRQCYTVPAHIYNNIRASGWRSADAERTLEDVVLEDVATHPAALWGGCRAASDGDVALHAPAGDPACQHV